MEKNIVITAKNIGKKYNIKHQQGKYIALRDVLMNIFRRPFSFFKSKVKKTIGLEKKEDFWALRNINFEINKGEVVGIIGHNGAGKSTLLKILTGITPPTEGEILMKGKVASLLEVGTGFHPELTGRENIFLNGAILGMPKKEIAQKFDDIVQFAGIEKFLDTPVKYYSSGMYVRLAFSVAAHLEPDILLVDEVLAVGDADFQKKSLGKMEEVTRQQGRTILFISHNMTAIEGLCKRSILIDKGKIVMFDETSKVIQAYLGEYRSSKINEWTGNVGDENLKLTRTSVRSLNPTEEFTTNYPIEITLESTVIQPIDNLIYGFTLFSEYGYELAYSLYDDNERGAAPTIKPGKFIKKFIIPADTLAQGTYRIEVDIGIHRTKRIVQSEGELAFTVENISGLGSRFPLPREKGRSSFFRPNWPQSS